MLLSQVSYYFVFFMQLSNVGTQLEQTQLTVLLSFVRPADMEDMLHTSLSGFWAAKMKAGRDAPVLSPIVTACAMRICSTP